MSMPEFPTINPPLTREDAINQIISSIAMEELALSHIINAEGEKLQYILGTLPGFTGPQPTIEQVLEVNQSVRGVLESAAEVQSALRSKLQAALTASTMRGATGATGPTGPTGTVESVATAFQAAMFNVTDTIDPDENFVFNEVLFNQGTDITYDDTTSGVITLNNDGVYTFYVVTFTYFSEGYGEDMPYTVTITVDGAPYSIISVSIPETQVTSTAVIPAAAAPFEIAVINSSEGSISLPAEGTQARITIVGYKS